MKRRELKEFVLAVRIYRLLREEAELAALQRERQKSEVLEQNLEQMVQFGRNWKARTDN